MSKRINILYAEDDIEVAQSVSRTLSTMDFVEKIDVVHNGSDAIDLFKGTSKNSHLTNLKPQFS